MLMRYIYSFDEAEDLHPLEIGGKGFGLARLVREGFRVPPGFIITTEACKYVLEHQSTPDTLIAEVNRNMGYLEEACARSFGSSKNPLVVSVRSGAPVSMPGMMDTLLNLGICRQAIKGLCEETEDVPFVVDLVLRFHRMFLEIVEGIEYSKINECIEGLIPHGAIGPTPSYELIDDFFTDLESREREVLGCVVPDDVQVQLERAVGAVFQSWNSRRAKAYRKHNNISHDMGTAVVIQEMVFGNRGDTSGSGVVFSRNPSIGNREIYGEFIFNGQGEDVVSGTHTPMTLEDAAKDIPDVVNELCEAVEKLERIYENVVDVEFTVEDRVLYLLQVRPAKLTASAAVKICSDFIDEGWTDPATAMELLTVEHIRELSRPRFDVAEVEKLRAEEQLLTTGLGASVGQSSGVIVTDPDRAERFVSKDQSVVLIRRTTSPLDLHGMLGAAAIVTATGGATSHAAVVARSIGTPCVVGCAQLEIFEDDDSIEINGRRIEPNTVVSVDGQTGEIFLGNIPTVNLANSSADVRNVVSQCRKLCDGELYSFVSKNDDIEKILNENIDGLYLNLCDHTSVNIILQEFLVVLLSNGPVGELFDDTKQDLMDRYSQVLNDLFSRFHGYKSYWKFGIDDPAWLPEHLGSENISLEKYESEIIQFQLESMLEMIKLVDGDKDQAYPTLSIGKSDHTGLKTLADKICGLDAYMTGTTVALELEIYSELVEEITKINECGLSFVLRFSPDSSSKEATTEMAQALEIMRLLQQDLGLNLGSMLLVEPPRNAEVEDLASLMQAGCTRFLSPIDDLAPTHVGLGKASIQLDSGSE